MPMLKRTVKNVYANGKEKDDDKLKQLLILYIKKQLAWTTGRHRRNK